MTLKTFLLLSLLVLSAVKAQEEEPPSAEDEEPPSSKGDEPMLNDQQAAYLKTYGYLKAGSEGSLESVETAIMNMQTFAGLQATGEMNEQTAERMKVARCSNADLEAKDTRSKRFVTSNNKWLDTDFTYKFHGYPTNTEGMSNADVEEALAKSFKRWSDIVPALKFTKTDGEAILNIRFNPKKHVDKYAFDGKGTVLAHAFYPRSGHIHFDDDEVWVKATPTDAGAKFLEFVATHEIGHSLGLKHSPVAGSVMRPYYPGFTPDFVLGPDDIEGIKSLYA